jgi:ribonucleotide reductase beta subunit family protein with ferritin-like domain
VKEFLFVNGKKKEVDSLIRALNNQSWKDIYFWGLHIEEYYVAKFHSASFEQIKYAGYLRNFKNEELVNSIQDYINYRDNVEIVQTELAAFYNQQLTPFINRSLDKQYLAENNVRKRPVFDSL